MKKIFSILSIPFLFLVILPASASAQEYNQPNLTLTQEEAYYKLKSQASSLNVDWNNLDNTPSWVRIKDLNIEWQSENYPERAYQFLKQYSDLYGLDNPQVTFESSAEYTDNLSMRHVILQQKYQGVEVYGAQLKFHFRSDGDVSSTNGTYLTNISGINTKPTLTEEKAIVIAQDKLKESLGINEVLFNNLDLHVENQGIYIYDRGLFTKQASEAQLIYKLKITSPGTLTSWFFYVNAHNGNIVKDYNNVDEAKFIESYVMADCADVSGILTYNQDSTDEADTVGSTSQDAETWDAHNYANNMYDYYAGFGRDSFDNNGAAIYLVTHFELDETDGDSGSDQDGDGSNDCQQYENAAWVNSGNPTTSYVRIGEDFESQDIVGHELAHAVTDYEANFEESEDIQDALDESYSDVFGTFVEFDVDLSSANWTIGEDLVTNGTEIDGNYCTEALRSLARPGDLDGDCIADSDDSDDYPDHMNDVDYSDYNAAGMIPSHALYLLVMGGTNATSGITVTGIEDMTDTDTAIAAAEQIYYRALTEYLTTSSDFSDAYQATLQSCIDLYEADPITYPFSYCESVYDAFTAVGIDTGASHINIVATATPESGYAPLTVDFDGADSVSLGGTITDYVWDFNTAIDSDGDGDSTNDSDNTGPVAANTYTSETTTHARLTITDDTLNSTYTSVAITVSNPIEPTFTVSGDQTTAPATVSFNASATTDATGTITDYSWDFGDGTTASSGTTATTAHTYTDPGTYTITLTVTDSNGYTQTTEATATMYVGSSIITTTWSADYNPYIISGGLTVASGYTLTIEPGVVIKFLNSSSYLTINGTLAAVGTSTDQIIFTSFKDDDYGGDTNGDGTATAPAAGDWRYIYFAVGSSAELEQVVMSYGGRTASTDYPMVRIYSTDVTFSHCSLTDSAYHVMYISGANPTITDCTISSAGTADYGLAVYSGAAPTLTSNTITDSAVGIYVSGSALPTVTNNTFTTNTYPIYWQADTLPTTTQLSGNTGSANTYDVIYLTGESNGDLTLAADTGLVPLLDDVTIAIGDLLTINAGVVVKFADSASTLSIYGELSASGETAAPIVFTSFQDDDYGGDTNGDGTTTTAAPNDWATIWFADGSTGTIDQAIIRYGGRDYSGGYKYMVRIESDNVTISDSILSDSETANIYVYGASPTIADNTISNAGSDYGGIALVYYANATITGNDLTNNDRGLYLSNHSNSTITDNVIQANDYGIYMYLNNGDVANISNNVITANTNYGIYNRDSSATVTAENNWWGDASGPYNATTNPTGTGDTVSSYVDFDPWTTTDPDADVTPPSDVTLVTVRKDAWTPSLTVNWTNPADSDFDHIQIDRTNVTAGTTTTLSSTETGTSYADTTISFNVDYAYTIYACDTSSNCSSGVTTSSNRLRNPAPTGLTLTAGDKTITVKAKSSAGSLGGYIIYYGTSRTTMTNTLDVGNVTTNTITGLTNGTRYYVTVSAYSKTGVESAPSAIKAAIPHH